MIILDLTQVFFKTIRPLQKFKYYSKALLLHLTSLIAAFPKVQSAHLIATNLIKLLLKQSNKIIAEAASNFAQKFHNIVVARFSVLDIFISKDGLTDVR